MKTKVLILAVVVVLNLQVTIAGASQIIIEDADTIWNATPEYSTDLTSITDNVTLRILTGYVNTIYRNDLYPSTDLINVANGVMPRILTEYANSVYRNDLDETPTDLTDLTNEVPSNRLIIEYANTNYYKELIFPVGLINGTTTTTTSTTITEPTTTTTIASNAVASLDWDGSNLIVEMESPAGVGKAQVKIEIPSEITVGDATAAGFMSGSTHMCYGNEHRWFQLTANGDTEGSLTIPITCSIGSYAVNLTEISLKDTTENSIIFDTEFPQVQYINCNECTLEGDNPPCGEVTLGEVVDFINLWAEGQASLSEVIDLINAWASG